MHIESIYLVDPRGFFDKIWIQRPFDAYLISSSDTWLFSYIGFEFICFIKNSHDFNKFSETPFSHFFFFFLILFLSPKSSFINLRMQGSSLLHFFLLFFVIFLVVTVTGQSSKRSRKQSFSSSDLEDEHSDDSQAIQFKCRLCQQTFKRSSNLAQHCQRYCKGECSKPITFVSQASKKKRK